MIIENTDYREEVLDLSNKFDVKLVKGFLKDLGFSFYPQSVDYTIILYNLKGDIIGTGSSQKNILKYVAVAQKFRETTAFAKIISNLTERIMQTYQNVFVCTRPSNIVAFEGLGFKHIESAEPLFALLEYGLRSVCNFQKELKKYRQNATSDKIAAIVVNCNPFTNGHKYLIEKASEENQWLYLFVVQEDFSVFPFETRWKLIKEGTSNLKNIVMIPGGDYVVSGKTFPYYFLKNIEEHERTARQAELDIGIFRKYICPVLGIKRRYVGTENYCSTTKAYNEAMKKLLPEKGIELIEIERVKGDVNGSEQFISASKIRESIKNNELEKFIAFIPEVTKNFLLSVEAKDIISKIEKSDSRH